MQEASKSPLRLPQCPRCKSTEFNVVHNVEVMDFKGLTLEVAGMASTVCRDCGNVWYTEGQELDNIKRLKAAFARRRDEIRSQDGLLTGEQIKEALSRLDVSKQEAAEIFGGGPNAFAKYIQGDVLQSYAMDRLIRLTVAFGKHAVEFLRHGVKTPPKLNSGGIVIAPLPVEQTPTGAMQAPYIRIGAVGSTPYISTQIAPLQAYSQIPNSQRNSVEVKI